ncbi:MAG TPA: HlyD family efflux transporter periplasmic adaptor subunit [Vicinamibacterales bacterium]|jgi:HlyD family secretion protein|nr:HlyD family efflux transporter periplasmic adaptor subunit [Vicinamibacterales bacterium]
MDVQRDPAILKRKQRNRAIIGVLVALGVVAVSVAVSRLQPALPAVTESTLWIRTVQRGAFTREVRGAGTLVPEEIRWIPAMTAGRVAKIVLRPGAQVEPGTVILELDNPDQRQTAASAEMDWKTAVAQLANQRATLANNQLAQKSTIVEAQSSLQLAKTDLDLNKALAEKGLVSAFTIKQKQAAVDQAENRLKLAQQQLEAAIQNESLQLAPYEATVNQKHADYERALRQLADLQVKAAMSGRLQIVSVEEGQQVSPGTNLARVSNPSKLKAEVRIPETQTRDVAIGQVADIDTRNGHVPGHVSRIDPASNGGTVGVDVTLDGPLPAGARPDLSIDGTIQLEKLASVLFVESPAISQDSGTISLFRKVGTEAVRTTVKIGRRSVQYVEVVDGLKEGDSVILSDMSQYDAFDRLKLQ